MSQSYSLDDLIALNQEILAISRAHVAMAPELAAAAKEMPGSASLLAQSIAGEMSQGRSLDEALATQGTRLPGFYTSVVRAGLKSDRLTSSLEELSSSLSRMQSVRQQVLLAFSYPFAIAAAAWVMLVLTAQNLGPMFEWIDLDHRSWLSALEVHGWRFWLLLLSVPVALLLGTVILWIRSQAPHGTFSTGLALADWLPGVRRVGRFTAYANFAELMHLMIAHRTPLPQALRAAGEAVAYRPVRIAADGLANRVDLGGLSTECSREAQGLPPLVKLGLLSASPQDGSSQSLAHAAAFYRERSAAALSDLHILLPAAATAVVGGLAVGMYAYLVLEPYYSALWNLSF